MATLSNIIKLSLLSIFFFQFNFLFSQIGFQDYEFDTTKFYRISYTEGFDFTGNFIEKRGEVVVFEDGVGSEIKCNVGNITKIRIVDSLNTPSWKSKELKPLFENVEPVALPDSPLIYIDLGFGGAHKTGIFGLGSNLIFYKNYGLSIDYHLINREARNLPPNYKAGDLCLFYCNPQDRLQTLSVNFLYEIPTSLKTFRLGLESGISFVNSRIIEFEPISPTWPYWETTNYIKSTLRENGMGVHLSLKSEFPFSQYVGGEFAIISNLNSFQPYVGWEICLTMGYVRN